MLYWGYAHFDEGGPCLLLSADSRRKVSLCFHKVVISKASDSHRGGNAWFLIDLFATLVW